MDKNVIFCAKRATTSRSRSARESIARARAAPLSLCLQPRIMGAVAPHRAAARDVAAAQTAQGSTSALRIIAVTHVDLNHDEARIDLEGEAYAVDENGDATLHSNRQLLRRTDASNVWRSGRLAIAACEALVRVASLGAEAAAVWQLRLGLLRRVAFRVGEDAGRGQVRAPAAAPLRGQQGLQEGLV